MSADLSYKLIVNEVKVRVVDESIARLKQCIKSLSIIELNFKCNTHTLSIAQSIVHLNGNVRQWLFQHLLNHHYSRNRDAEFIYEESSAQELLKVLEQLEQDLIKYIPDLLKLTPSNDILIQGMQNTTVSALIHVIEHFSYHTGQVALLNKIISKQDLGFYANHGNL